MTIEIGHFLFVRLFSQGIHWKMLHGFLYSRIDFYTDTVILDDYGAKCYIWLYITF